MTLPPEAQGLVDRLRAVLGVPPCQITISCDDAGVVQTIQPLVTYRREKVERPPMKLSERRPGYESYVAVSEKV